MTLSLDTLVLLRDCLHAQVLTVGDPNFAQTAARATVAAAELDQAIQKAQHAEGTP
jgi:hypothetical protein